MTTTDLDAIADALYRLVPAEFVAARDAKAAEVRTAGDRAGATEIKALRRPTQGAWMVNWLARERAGDLGRLLELGAALRVAQDRMAGDELRTLSRQRHAVVAALAADARRAAADVGLPAGDAATREVEETLNAALADDRAAAAVRAGHLSTALDYSGFGEESRAAAATSDRRPPPREEQKHRASTEQREHEKDRRRRLEEAEAAVAAAQAEAVEAHRTAEDRARQVEEARERLDQLRHAIHDLEARLDGVRREEDDAAAHLRGAQQAREEADRVVRERDDEAAAARSRLEGLRRRESAAGRDP